MSGSRWVAVRRHIALMVAAAVPLGAAGLTLALAPAAQAAITGTGPVVAAAACTVTAQLNDSSTAMVYGSESQEVFTATLTPNSPSCTVALPSGRVNVTTSTPTGPLILCVISFVTDRRYPPPHTCEPAATAVPAASYQVYGFYSGDLIYDSATSNTLTVKATPEKSATSLKLSTSTVTSGHENGEHLTIQVRPQYPGTATGKVTITAKTAHGKPIKVCVVTLKAGTGTCTLPARALSAGTYTLTAAYGGSPGISTSESPKRTLIVRT